MRKPLEQPTKDIPPAVVVILLTCVMPGAGQLALEEKKRGWLFAGVAILVFLVFLFFLSRFGVTLLDEVNAGRPLSYGGPLKDHLVGMGYALVVGLAVMVAALVDALLLRVKKRDEA